MKKIAVVLAGGRGSRMNSDIPKAVSDVKKTGRYFIMP